VQRTGLQQRAQHHTSAAGMVQVAGEKSATRLQVGDERRAREHHRHVVEREADARLVRDGFGEKVLMSQDIFLKSLLRSYGGPGYGHMVEFFLPRLARHGVPIEQGVAMMTANPRTLFESAS
jgi:predicted metal-dependent phosphotriesterase family hydrolase